MTDSDSQDGGLDRREFLQRGAAAAAGVGLGEIGTAGRRRTAADGAGSGSDPTGRPVDAPIGVQQAGGSLVLTSHTNETGREAMRRSWAILSDDGRALDAVLEGANVIEVDLAGVTTTSGLSWKVPGRVGDSPIIGAGLYVDNEVGAAGATGRGEDVIKSCASHYIVMRMRAGRSPQEACEDAVELIASRYRGMGLDFLPGEKFVALNKAGEYGCVRMASSVPARMTVHGSGGQAVHEGALLYPTG